MSAVTISTTEISIVSGTSTLQTVTTKGIYSLYIDASNMVKGDEFEVKIYDKVISGGTKRVAFRQTISDAQSEMLVFPDIMLFNGWDMTIVKKGGSDQTFTASIRAVTGAGLSDAYTQSALTITTTEKSLISGTTTLSADTTACKIQVWADLSNLTLTDGDDLYIRIYEKCLTGGTKRQVYQAIQLDTQIELFFTPVFTVMNGWDVTAVKVNGTNKTIDAAIRKVA